MSLDGGRPEGEGGPVAAEKRATELIDRVRAWQLQARQERVTNVHRPA
jgi:hypothetical protein